jgi:hypothetical protein
VVLEVKHLSVLIRVHLWPNKNKKPASLLSPAGWFILPGFYRQITFPALIMMFSCPDGKCDHY